MSTVLGLSAYKSLLSDCPSLRTLLGVATPAAAIAKIYEFGIDEDELVRPFALIRLSEFARVPNAEDTWDCEGVCDARIEVPRQVGAASWSDEYNAVMSAMQSLTDEITALGAGGSFLRVRDVRFRTIQQSAWNDPKSYWTFFFANLMGDKLMSIQHDEDSENRGHNFYRWQSRDSGIPGGGWSQKKGEIPSIYTEIERAKLMSQTGHLSGKPTGALRAFMTIMLLAILIAVIGLMSGCAIPQRAVVLRTELATRAEMQALTAADETDAMASKLVQLEADKTRTELRREYEDKNAASSHA